MERVLNQALRTFLPYAGRHGYDMIVGEDESGGRPYSWGKVRTLERLLQSYEEVLWIDADIVILDFSIDLASVVPDGAFQALVEARSLHARHPNMGVWLVRADSRSLAFLRAVWERTEFINHHWWEQAAAMHLLGYDAARGPNPVASQEWSSGTHWLGQEWNMLVGSHGVVPCRFRHYAATSNERRVRWMKADAEYAEAALYGWTRARRLTYRLGTTMRFLDRYVPRSTEDIRILKGKVQRRWQVGLSRRCRSGHW
jgi:hypothetical protein